MSPQAGWILKEEIAPRLQASIPRNVRCVGAEDPQELIQDAICMSARMLDRLEQQHKLGTKAGASNVAYFTIEHMRSGRRSYGSQTVDALGVAAQYQGHSELHSLSETITEPETGDQYELQDNLSNDSEDPSTIAARRMDWALVLAGFSEDELELVHALADGLTVRQIAITHHITGRRIQQLLDHLAQRVIQVMGLDAIADCQKRPQWQINLQTWNEQLACAGDRKSCP